MLLVHYRLVTYQTARRHQAERAAAEPRQKGYPYSYDDRSCVSRASVANVAASSAKSPRVTTRFFQFITRERTCMLRSIACEAVLAQTALAHAQRGNLDRVGELSDLNAERPKTPTGRFKCHGQTWKDPI